MTEDRTAAERMRRYRKRLKEGIVERKKDQLLAAGLLQPADRDNDAAVRAAEDKFWAKTPADSVADAVPDAISGEILGKSDISVENPVIQPVKAPSRPLSKREALAAYRELLGGAELPRELIARATAADLVAAHARIVAINEDLSTPGSQGRWGENNRYKALRDWKLLQSDAKAFTERHAIPILKEEIQKRRAAEAEVARAAPSVNLPKHWELEIARDLLPAGADPDENREALKAATLDAIRGGMKLRKDQVQNWEHEARVRHYVLSYPPWGGWHRKTKPSASPKPIEQGIAPAPVAVERDLEQETRRTAALGELRAKLRGGELPAELVAEASVEDLGRALEGCLSAAGLPAGREPTPADRMLQRSWDRHSPADLVEMFGVPLLREAIDQGRAKEAARKKAERQAHGVDDELLLSPAEIDELMDLWDPSADRTDLAVVALAVDEVIRIWINRPPPPRPTASYSEAERAYDPAWAFRQSMRW